MRSLRGPWSFDDDDDDGDDDDDDDDDEEARCAWLPIEAEGQGLGCHQYGGTY